MENEGFGEAALLRLQAEIDRCGATWRERAEVPKRGALILAELSPAIEACAWLYGKGMHRRIQDAGVMVSEAVVSRLWEESRDEHWPARLNEAAPAGVDLAALDVRLSGCIHTWLFHRNSFGIRHLHTVEALLRDLKRALPELTEEDNLRLWQRYWLMAQIITDSSADPVSPYSP